MEMVSFCYESLEIEGVAISCFHLEVLGLVNFGMYSQVRNLKVSNNIYCIL